MAGAATNWAVAGGGGLTVSELLRSARGTLRRCGCLAGGGTLNGSEEREVSFAEGGGGRMAMAVGLVVLEDGSVVSGVKESPNGTLPKGSSLDVDGPNGSDGVIFCI